MWSSHCGTVETNLTRNHEDSGRSLASLNGLKIRLCLSCDVSHRCGSNLVLLWLWCRLAAIAPIRPLAWNHCMPQVQP